MYLQSSAFPTKLRLSWNRHNIIKRETSPIQEQNINPVPYTPFSNENGEETICDSGIKHDCAWYDKGIKIGDNRNILITYLCSELNFYILTKV